MSKVIHHVSVCCGTQGDKLRVNLNWRDVTCKRCLSRESWKAKL